MMNKISLILVVAVIAALALANIPTTAATWFNPALQYKRPIYCTGTGLSSTTTEWVPINSTSFTIGKDTMTVWANITSPSGSTPTICGYLYYNNANDFQVVNSAETAQLAWMTEFGNDTNTPSKIHPDLTGWFFMNTTENARDNSELKRDGTKVGTPTSVAGKISNCTDFDGTGDYFNRGNLDMGGNGNTTLSICYWIYVDTDSNGGAVGKMPGSGATGYWTGYSAGSNALQGYVTTASGDSAINIVLSNNLQVWYHYCITYDAAATRFYLNGVLNQTDTTPGGAIKSNSNGQVIGLDSDAGTGDLDGRLDDVRIYNDTLTADEVMMIYSGVNSNLTWLGSETTSAPLFTSNTAEPASGVSFPVTNISFNITITHDNTIINATVETNLSGVMKNYTLTNTSTIFNWSIIGGLAAGVYQYKYYVNDSTVTLYNSSTYYYTIAKASPGISLASANGWSILEGISNTISCTAATTTILSRDGMVITNPLTSVLYFGSYSFSCTSAATQNYTAGSTSNTLVVSSTGFGCFGNSTYAFEANVTTTGTDNYTMDFSTLVTLGFVRKDLGDIFVATGNNLPAGRINLTNKFFVVNSTGQTTMTIRFGNAYINNSYSEAGNTSAINNFSYNQINSYIVLNFLNERTGQNVFPPSANTSVTMFCTGGTTDFNLINQQNLTLMLLPSASTIQRIRNYVYYSSTIWYNRDYVMSSQFERRNVYLVDAMTNQVLQIAIQMQDNTGSQFSGALLTVKKNIEANLRDITMQYFDMSGTSLVYLINGDSYSFYVANSAEERSLGTLTVNPNALTRTIVLNPIINYSGTTGMEITANFYNVSNAICWQMNDTAGRTISTEFWVYNASSKVQLYYANSTNHSAVTYCFTINETNTTYTAKYAIHHPDWGVNTDEGSASFFGLGPPIWNPFSMLTPFASNLPHGLLITNIMGVFCVIFMAMIYATRGTMGALIGSLTGVIMLVLGWWQADFILLALAVVLAFIEHSNKNRRPDYA